MMRWCLLPLLAILSVAHAVTEEEQRMLMLQQLFVEERVRSDGDSGIKHIRHEESGTRPYHANSYTGQRVADVHDHVGLERTIGMGEFVAVLSGVEFRTIHNDYKLVQPIQGRGYHETEPIKFPDVPEAVSKQPTVRKQIVEMREWFKAWKNQRTRRRDYRPFFKPVLCYLEGAWLKNTKTIDENPFDNDRHFIDAHYWSRLHDKVRFMSYSGGQSPTGNYPYLPTTIIDIVDGKLVFAQWNYRILCHPLKDDLPLNRLRVINELAPRMANDHKLFEHEQTTAARFQLNPTNKTHWRERRYPYGMLDRLMMQIPGVNNYRAVLHDKVGTGAYEYLKVNGEQQLLNIARYHRIYRNLNKDAMGITVRSRGFSDSSVFMASTTERRVAGMKFKICKGSVCKMQDQKWTYAIPLEIIYMNPLMKWNPLNITMKTGDAAAEVKGAGRDGRTKKTAFNGRRDDVFYFTPDKFYMDKVELTAKANKKRAVLYATDAGGIVRRVRGSGTRVILPYIDQVGKLRQRYPIMPVHAEGSAVWKELEALKDYVMQMKLSPRDDQGITLLIAQSRATTVSARHKHVVNLTAKHVTDLKAGRRITVNSEFTFSHRHHISVRYNVWADKFIMIRCDDDAICKDLHPKVLLFIE